jgi:hypothetical protein
MPDTQIHPLGVEPAPADYPVPDTAELLLKSVRATFDGSGAAGPFVPLLRIISDAGSITDEIPQDVTVAAGASADATWFPHVAAAPQSAPAPGTGLTWAYLSSSSTTTIGTTGTTVINPGSARFYTSDSGTFDVHQNAGIGNAWGIRFLAQGHYLIFGNAQPTTKPATGAQYELVEQSTGGADSSYFAGLKQLIFPAGGLTDQGDVDLNILQTASVALSGLPTAPLVYGIVVTGTMGSTFHAGICFVVVKLDGDGTNLL